MSTPSLSHRTTLPVKPSLILLAPLPPTKYLTNAQPPGKSPLSPSDLSLRAVAITALMQEVLAQMETATHGGIKA